MYNSNEDEDSYKPFVCQLQHQLTAKQISEDGFCGKCGTEVVFCSNRDEIRKVLVNEANAPVPYIVDDRGRKLRLRQKECKHCITLFETPYARNPFCSDACREAYEIAEIEKKPRCRVCGKVLDAPDRRWKYCTEEACEKYRRGKAVPDGDIVL